MSLHETIELEYYDTRHTHDEQHCDSLRRWKRFVTDDLLLFQILQTEIELKFSFLLANNYEMTFFEQSLGSMEWISYNQR